MGGLDYYVVNIFPKDIRKDIYKVIISKLLPKYYLNPIDIS